MSWELIRKVRCPEFREVLTGYVQREIAMVFEADGSAPRAGFRPQESYEYQQQTKGKRRTS